MPALTPEAADWLWLKLRKTFPAVLSACLMPDHMHVLLWPDVVPDPAARLGRMLGGFSRRVGLPRYWASVPQPTVVPNLVHFRRTVRYIHANPWREGLVKDPLEWPWSTHRDAIGARYSPWLQGPVLAKALRFRESGFPEYFHRYVCKDRDLKPENVMFPVPLRSIGRPLLAPAEVVGAVQASGTYLGVEARVRLLSHAARHEGWPVARFAGWLGKSERTMQRYAREDIPRLSSGLRGAPDPCALCLGDERLRAVPSFPVQRSGVVSSKARRVGVRLTG